MRNTSSTARSLRACGTCRGAGDDSALSFFDDIARAYDAGIQTPGQELHFLVLLAFAVSFGIVRATTHMIRAEVSWWPGNVETKGGTHVHHMVWGILLLIVAGYAGITVDPRDSPWPEIVAVAFGIGMALTLDEFALWLNLEDVYWSAKGRQSIEAVTVTASLLAIALLGLQFWIDVREALLLLLGFGGDRLEEGESTLILTLTQAMGVALAAVAFLKGKVLWAVVGVFVPLVAVISAIRLAKPDSRWARRRYDADKLDRSRQRFPPRASGTAAAGAGPV